MKQKTALVVGATGVVGRELVTQLIGDDRYKRIMLWVRRPYPISHEKLDVRIIDFTTIEALPSEYVDEIFCALGTSLKKAGSVEAFRRVDVTYPIAVARWGRRSGVKRFVLVSAIGADPHSPLRYFKAKGDTEAAITALYYDSLQIAHPFLIIGERGDSRPVERSAAWLFDRTFGRRFSRFQPSDGKQIAAVMIEKAQLPIPNQPTVYRYHPQEFQAPRTR